MAKTIFLTGGTGFIGLELIKRLVQEGHEVHALYRSENKLKELPDFPGKEQIHFFKGDLDDLDAIKQAMEGCDEGYHIAALARAWSEDKDDFYDINVKGTQLVGQAATEAGIKKLVFTSTGGTLASGEIGAPADENTPRKTGFFNLYEQTKFYAEQEIIKYATDQLSVVIVNPTRVYGPGHLSISNAATKLIELYMTGKWRLMLGKGKSVGNFTYVRDVVEGHINAMENGKSGQQYILGGENLSLQGFFQKIGEQSGKQYKMIKIPMGLALAFAKLQKAKANIFKTPPMITDEWVKKYYQNWACTSEKARREIGYEITPADQAFRETIQWIEENKKE